MGFINARKKDSLPSHLLKKLHNWTKHKSFVGTFKNSWVSLGKLHQSKQIWLKFWLILTWVKRELF